jgi:stage II sporulation protein D
VSAACFKKGVYALLFSPLLVFADVRVGLFQKELPDHFWVSAAGGLRVLDVASGRSIGTAPDGKPVTLEKMGEDVRMVMPNGEVEKCRTVRLEPVQAGDELEVGTLRIEKRSFRGILEIQARPRELLAVNIVPEDDYVTAAVAGEMPVSWPQEALKAQAVVARTYMRKNHGRHRADGYDFCDLAHCQVYQGTSHVNSAVRRAVEQTHDEVLLYHGAPIEAFFHSTCGGRTASNEDVWHSPPRPYLRSQSDSDGFRDFCQKSPDYRWTVQMTRQELSDILRPLFTESADPGRLESLQIRSADPAGRVKELEVLFTGAHTTISGDTLYLLWGRSSRWHQLKSAWFQMNTWGDTFEFRGNGLGHGVGMCQWGANGRAAQGANYRDILAHYFTGVQVSR